MVRLLLPGWVSKKPWKKQGKAAGTFQTPLAEGRGCSLKSFPIRSVRCRKTVFCSGSGSPCAFCHCRGPLFNASLNPPRLSQPGARAPSGQGLFHGPLAHFLCLKQGKGLGTNVSLFLGKSFFPPALLGTSLLGMEPAAALKG